MYVAEFNDKYYFFDPMMWTISLEDYNNMMVTCEIITTVKGGYTRYFKISFPLFSLNYFRLVENERISSNRNNKCEMV